MPHVVGDPAGTAPVDGIEGSSGPPVPWKRGRGMADLADLADAVDHVGGPARSTISRACDQGESFWQVATVAVHEVTWLRRPRPFLRCHEPRV